MKQISDEKISNALKRNKPFNELSDAGFELLKNNLRTQYCEIGERICRDDEIPSGVYLVLDGEVRLMANSLQGNGLITLEKRGRGQFFGWISLIRGQSCEIIQASTDCHFAIIPSEVFIRLIKLEDKFGHFFYNLSSIHEAWEVGKEVLKGSPRPPKNIDQYLKKFICSTKLYTFKGNNKTNIRAKNVYLSTPGCQDLTVGALINENKVTPPNGFLLPIRAVQFAEGWLSDSKDISVHESSKAYNKNEKEQLQVGKQDLEDLGIIEHKNLRDDDQYPLIKGRGIVKEGAAIIEMISLYYKLPFKRDLVMRALKERENRINTLNYDLMGGLCQSLQIQTQRGVVKPEHLNAVDFPAIEINNDDICVHWKVKNGCLISSQPNKGLFRTPISDRDPKSNIELLLVKPSINAEKDKFGWSWFTPLVKKYKWALVLVFAATLLAQLMGLAIPLLLQQIIDKVLSQGNLSTLNVLGGTMVVLALFQGLLTALRQFIFVDTTDRMDLTLGSAVIDRLLALPLRYFERRPVGELSQRLGELNTIRSFLTGTALISVLNLLFASLYLVVMIIYSPLLTAIALSTFPIYMILVVVISPIFKNMIRKRAVAAAKTQSHLIEVLTGIQTIKAQNVQLSARWKWQDRYKEFVNQGFRTVTVGVATSQTGSFLTQLSSLLVLWVGMIEVLNGNLTLGQLIAFRIIAGNVTTPLLQLSTLWQGFQGVQLSMERLGDIINQESEQTEIESNQIALPPIEGQITYDNVRFRFNTKQPEYQVDGVSLDIDPGKFVGIVGESGSGKSTLMKLLPRLYNIEEGRIMIDGYDISKVELGSLRRQIGIVPQDSLLFEGTVAENIALNDPTIDDEGIIEAATIACAHDFIMGLPNGYATQLAERGANLSGGQRQRIAIARTLVSNPKLLVMDEATSALDYETERIVCMNLQEWARGKTVLFITHRLSTIQNADSILMMNRGKLAEKGTHEELIRLNGRYATLFGKQGLS